MFRFQKNENYLFSETGLDQKCPQSSTPPLSLKFTFGLSEEKLELLPRSPQKLVLLVSPLKKSEMTFAKPLATGRGWKLLSNSPSKTDRLRSVPVFLPVHWQRQWGGDSYPKFLSYFVSFQQNVSAKELISPAESFQFRRTVLATFKVRLI